MPDKPTESEEVRVVDRRRFTAEGDRRAGVEAESPAAPPPTASQSPPNAPAAVGSPESAQSREARQGYERMAGSRPKFDFETLVRSFAGTAMLQLGLVEDPIHGRIPPDFEAARETIDMLGLLEEKTRGNLTAQEQRFLDDVLYQLRASFVALTSGAAARGAALGGKSGAPKPGK